MPDRVWLRRKEELSSEQRGTWGMCYWTPSRGEPVAQRGDSPTSPDAPYENSGRQGIFMKIGVTSEITISPEPEPGSLMF